MAFKQLWYYIFSHKKAIILLLLNQVEFFSSRNQPIKCFSPRIFQFKKNLVKRWLIYQRVIGSFIVMYNKKIQHSEGRKLVVNTLTLYKVAAIDINIQKVICHRQMNTHSKVY